MKEKNYSKNITIMTDKTRNVGNGIGIAAALGLLFGVVYSKYSGNSTSSIAMGLAFGTALGAIFDFTRKKK